MVDGIEYVENDIQYPDTPNPPTKDNASTTENTSTRTHTQTGQPKKQLPAQNQPRPQQNNRRGGRAKRTPGKFEDFVGHLAGIVLVDLESIWAHRCEFVKPSKSILDHFGIMFRSKHLRSINKVLGSCSRAQRTSDFGIWGSAGPFLTIILETENIGSVHM